jgi:hypothetical protein
MVFPNALVVIAERLDQIFFILDNDLDDFNRKESTNNFFQIDLK